MSEIILCPKGGEKMANIKEAIEHVREQQSRQLAEREAETRRLEAVQEQGRAEWQLFLASCRTQGAQILQDSSLPTILQEVKEQIFKGVGKITPVEGEYGHTYSSAPTPQGTRRFSSQGARVVLQTETPSHLVRLAGIATVEVDHQSRVTKTPRLKIECLAQPKPRGIWDRLRRLDVSRSVDVLIEHSFKDTPDIRVREWENPSLTRQAVARVLLKAGIVV